MTQQLAETSQFLTNLIDSSPNIVIATDEIGYISLFNRTGEEVFGCKKRKVIGRHIAELLHNPKELERYQSIAEKGNAVEILCRKIGGQTFPARMYMRNIDETESTRRILYLLTDITWQKNIEAKLALSEKLATYSELMAGIAHQLNNPLIGVVNFSSLLLEKMSHEDANRCLVETISEAARKCHQMLSSITKSLSEPKSTYHEVNLSEVLESAILTAMQDEASAAGKVSLLKRIPRQLPAIRGDSLQLLEVFRNIIVNAFQAMPDGGKLAIITRVNTKTGVLQTAISDSGMGIPRDKLPFIFNPFFSTKTNSKGGLGLSFAFQIVKNHGGRIDVRSSAGKGSVFKVALPIFREVKIEETRKRRG